MRIPQIVPALLLLTSLALAGCGGDDDGDGGTTTSPTATPTTAPTTGPTTTPGPTPTDTGPVEVFNDTLVQGIPGGEGSMPFTVPTGPYTSLSITKSGDATLRGTITLNVVAPDGTETSLLDGSYVQDDAAGVALPGLGCPSGCEFTVSGAAPGEWSFTWSVQGEMRLPFTVVAG